MKKFIIILLITFGVTIIPTFFLDFNTNYLVKPALFPPKILFPIVWSILYLLMTISLNITTRNNKLYKIYSIQLILNSLWSPIFFGFKLYLLSAIILILLIISVIIMIYQMIMENKVAGYLQIPYLLWLLFALYLNLSIYLLN